MLKVGDLVKMKKEFFIKNPYGIGFLISYHPEYLGCNCVVLFPNIMSASHNGEKWCNINDLELVSESR